MRKITLLLLTVISVSAFGQKLNLHQAQLKKEKAIVDIYKAPKHQNQQKALGDTIWSNDFSNSTDWVISNETGDNQDWVISTSTSTTLGYGTGAIQSTTASNGYALFDSDAVGSDGGIQNAHITTANPIDLSAYSSVAIRCQQRVRMWQSTQTNIGISTDGVTWNYIAVNTALPQSSLCTDDINLNISAYAAGQSAVYLRFNYQGSWDYAWMVDDIAIVEAAVNEIAIETPYAEFYGFGYYSMLPSRQTMNVTTFKTAIFNNGAVAQTDISLDVNVEEAGSMLWTRSSESSLASLAASARDTIWADTNIVTEDDVFVPDVLTTQYDIVYHVQQSETDEAPSTNYDTLSFWITDSVLARDVARTTYTGPARYDGSADGDFMGVYAIIMNDDTIKSISAYINSNTTVGGTILGRVYINNGGTLDALLETDMLDLDSTHLGTWVTLPVITDGLSEIVPGETAYCFGFETYWQGVDPNGGVYFGADNAGPHDYQNSALLLQSDGWGYITAVPMIRLNFNVTIPQSGVGENEANVLNIQNYPNPFSNSTEITYSLPSSEDVNIVVTDITGKTISVQDLGKQLAGNHTFNLEMNVESGIYYYTVNAGEYSQTRKMVVVK